MTLKTPKALEIRSRFSLTIRLIRPWMYSSWKTCCRRPPCELKWCQWGLNCENERGRLQGSPMIDDFLTDLPSTCSRNEHAELGHDNSCSCHPHNLGRRTLGPTCNQITCTYCGLPTSDSKVSTSGFQPWSKMYLRHIRSYRKNKNKRAAFRESNRAYPSKGPPSQHPPPSSHHSE